MLRVQRALRVRVGHPWAGALAVDAAYLAVATLGLGLPSSLDA
jgi:hypothetical protein